MLITKYPTVPHNAFHPFFTDCLQRMIYGQNITPAQCRAFKVTAGNDICNFVDESAGSMKRGDVLVTPCPRKDELDNNEVDKEDVDDTDTATNTSADELASHLTLTHAPHITIEVGFSVLRVSPPWYETGCKTASVRSVVITVNLAETPHINLQPPVHEKHQIRVKQSSALGPAAVPYPTDRIRSLVPSPGLSSSASGSGDLPAT